MANIISHLNLHFWFCLGKHEWSFLHTVCCCLCIDLHKKNVYCAEQFLLMVRKNAVKRACVGGRFTQHCVNRKTNGQFHCQTNLFPRIVANYLVYLNLWKMKFVWWRDRSHDERCFVDHCIAQSWMSLVTKYMHCTRVGFFLLLQWGMSRWKEFSTVHIVDIHMGAFE